VNGQSECSEAGISLCNSTNQLCQVEKSSNGEQLENCYVCREGYIEFGRTNESSGCIDVSNLDLESFMEHFRAQFDAEESLVTREERLQLLQAVASYVSQHNAQQPPPAFTLGLNKYSADSEDEALQIRGYKQTDDPVVLQDLPFYQSSDEDGTLSDAVDWVAQGAVTSVKDQGRCGCCWAVAAAGVIEGAAAITSNYSYLQSVSFQQMISCSDVYNQGCDGGLPGLALLYSIANQYGGMSILNDYGFSDERGETTAECEMTEDLLKVVIEEPSLVVSSSVVESFTTRLEKMKKAVAKGPVSVAIKSNCEEMSSYRSGILTSDGDCACSPDMSYCLDHAILMVGYNDSHNPPYWKLKNSWSTDWGEDGYFRIAQTNPSGDFSWGLFGVLAEGCMVNQAFNRTEGSFDIPQETDLLPMWAIIFITALAGVICATICSFAVNKLRSKEQ
jgi:cathepsin L